MGFDDEDRGHENANSTSIFGFEVSNGIAYTGMAILALILIRQVYVLL